MEDTIFCGNCVDVMRDFIEDESIDLTITSPPYDDLRDYKGYEFIYESIAYELFRVTKTGGVVVWVVGDQTKNCDKSLTSFKQAIYFKENIGFKVHDVMIYKKVGMSFPEKVRYYNNFEYMFIFVKGKLKTFNPIEDVRNITYPRGQSFTTKRQKDGSLKYRKQLPTKEFSKRYNIWEYNTGFQKTTKDIEAFQHPAMFPEKLAKDHIISWSNEGDVILDPMCGSGTTLKMAYLANRKYIGIDISPEYCEIAEQRLKTVKSQMRMF